MWANVQDELAAILSSRVFPSLAQDTGYRLMFRNAGLTGKLPPDIAGLPPAIQEKLRQAAQMCAQLVTRHVEGLAALRERRAKAVVLAGPLTLYRLWSQRKNDQVRAWWFTAGVLDQAISASAGNRGVAIDWLRDRLAVSFDWNDCDRVARRVLHPGNALPAIEALGLPMRKYSRDAPGAPGVSMKDYWANYTDMFQGRKTQYFLPFVPPSRVSDFW